MYHAVELSLLSLVNRQCLEMMIKVFNTSHFSHKLHHSYLQLCQMLLGFDLEGLEK